MGETDLTGTATSAEAAAKALDNLTQSSDKAQKAIGGLNGFAAGANEIFDAFEKHINNFNITLETSGAYANKAAAQFGILSVAILGSQKAFQGMDFSSMGLNTFTEQITNMKATLASSPLSKMLETFKSMGVEIPAAQAKTKAAALTFAQSFLQSADNALTLQTGLLKLSAQTGNLGHIYTKAGPQLKSMNAILAEQNIMMVDAARATGNSNRKQIENFYMALASVPQALESVVKVGDDADTSMSMLTATMKLATATQREYPEVIKDLHKAFTDYGLVGKDALSFTARFTELSSKLGIEFDVMKNGLLGATSAFQTLTDAGDASFKMTESMSNIMNKYVEGLKASHMTGQHAVEVVKNMTGAMSNLKVEQRAFLSAQTGGPGGLMGAAQIEKMMREGKIDEVMEKVMGSMEKMTGKAVTLEEASKSESAAATRQKQITLFQQGPLGKLAQNPEDAGRLLETYRAKKEGRVVTGDLDENVLKTAIDKSSETENLSYTKLSEHSISLMAIQKSTETANLLTLQRVATASPGGADLNGPSDLLSQNRLDLIASKQAGIAASGKHQGEFYRKMKDPEKGLADKSPTYMKESIDFYTKSLKSLVPSSLAAGQAIAQLGPDKEEDSKEKLAELAEDINKRKASRRGYSSLNSDDFGKTIKPGAQVGAAQRGQPSKKAARGGAEAPEVSVSEEGSSGRIKVDVKVKVNEIGSQATGITPAGNVAP
jgi:hypothetical protein